MRPPWISACFFFFWVAAVALLFGVYPFSSPEALGPGKTALDRGAAFLDQNQPERAAGELQQAVRERPADARAHLLLCRALRMGPVLGLPEAEAECLKATELKSAGAEAYHELGIVYNASGKLAEAVTAWESAVRRDPKYALAYYDLGLGYYDQKRMPKAVQAYRAAIAAGHGAPELGSGISLAAVYANLGVAYLALSEDLEAQSAFRKAAALDSKGDAGLLAREYLRAMAVPGKVPAGRRTGGKIFAPPGFSSVAKNSEPRHLARARGYYGQKRYVEAALEFEKAIQSAPRDPNPHISLGGIWMLQGRMPEAEREFQNGLALLKKGQPLRGYCYSRLGDIAWLAKKPEAAARRYLHAVQINPQDANAAIGLGRCYEALALWDKAAASYRKGLDLDPKNQLAQEGLRRSEEQGESDSDILAEMKQRKMLEPDRKDFTDQERAVVLDMRRAERAGAVDYLKAKLTFLNSLVVEKRFPSGSLRLLLTAAGWDRYRFLRSQDSIQAFGTNGVEAKYVFYLRDRRGESLYDSAGRLTPSGERVYAALLNGRREWLLPSEPVPPQPGQRPVHGDSPEITSLRLAGYEEISSAELQWLIRETGCSELVLEREFTLKTVADAKSKTVRYFVHSRDILTAFIGRYRAGQTSLQGLNGTAFFGSGGGKLCQ